MIIYLSISISMAFITAIFLSKKILQRFYITGGFQKIMQIVIIFINLLIWPFLVIWILFDLILYFDKKFYSKTRNNKNNLSSKIEKIFKCKRCKKEYTHDEIGKIRHFKKNGQSYTYTLCTECDLDILFRKRK